MDSVTIAQSDKVTILKIGEAIRLVVGENQREPTREELALIEIINTLVNIKLPIMVNLENGRKRNNSARKNTERVQASSRRRGAY